MGRKEFDEKGETVGLMVWMSNTSWITGKVVVINSGFCVMEGLILIYEQGVFGLSLINKQYHWPKGALEDKQWSYRSSCTAGKAPLTTPVLLLITSSVATKTFPM